MREVMTKLGNPVILQTLKNVCMHFRLKLQKSCRNFYQWFCKMTESFYAFLNSHTRKCSSFYGTVCKLMVSIQLYIPRFWYLEVSVSLRNHG